MKINLPCGAAGFLRLDDIMNPSGQTSGCAHVSKPGWFKPVSFLRGTTGSLRYDEQQEAVKKTTADDR